MARPKASGSLVAAQTAVLSSADLLARIFASQPPHRLAAAVSVSRAWYDVMRRVVAACCVTSHDLRSSASAGAVRAASIAPILQHGPRGAVSTDVAIADATRGEVFIASVSLASCRPINDGGARTLESTHIIAEPSPSGRLTLYILDAIQLVKVIDGIVSSRSSSLPAASRPAGMARTRSNIFVSDSALGCIHWFDKQPAWRGSLGNGEYVSPAGLAALERARMLLVVESGGQASHCNSIIIAL